MKKLSSVFFMWMGFALAMVAVLAMFVPFVEVHACTRSAADVFFDGIVRNGAWPVFVGFMLLLLGGIALAVMALPMFQPSADVEKIVLISAIVAIGLGLILISLVAVFLVGFNSNIAWDNGQVGLLLPGWYITLLFGGASIVMAVKAAKLDW